MSAEKNPVNVPAHREPFRVGASLQFRFLRGGKAYRHLHGERVVRADAPASLGSARALASSAAWHHSHPMRPANMIITAMIIPLNTDSSVILKKCLIALDILPPWE